jgi:hypothetical protein
MPCANLQSERAHLCFKRSQLFEGGGVGFDLCAEGFDFRAHARFLPSMLMIF